MDDFTNALEGLIDDARLPDRPSVARLKLRTRRRMQRQAFGGLALVAALVLGLIFGLMPGGAPKTVRSASAELTAFIAGRNAIAQAGGPPVYTYGTIGSNGLWVLNGDGLFISANGASAFRQITPPLGGSPIARVLAVQFLDATDGFVLADTSEGVSLTLDRSTNGGTSWNPVLLPNLTPNGIDRATMDFLNNQDGFIALEGYVSASAVEDFVLATTDGGMTWTVIDEAAPVATVAFTSSETGWGLNRTNASNQLYRTTNGGTSWSPVSLPLPEEVTWEIPSFFGNNGVIIGRPLNTGSSQPEIAVTTDGGSSWTLTSPPPFSEPSCASQICTGALPFSAVSSTNWFYWAGLDLYLTTNGGTSWTDVLPNIAFPKSGQAIVHFVTGSVYSNPRSPLTFTPAMNGWAIVSSGDVSLILATHDGGRHFTAYSPPSGAP